MLALLQHAPLVMFGEPQMARDRVVHGCEESISAAKAVAAAEIGLHERRRQFEEHPPCGNGNAAVFEILRLLIGIAVEFMELVAEGANRAVMDDAAQRAQPSCQAARSTRS